MAVGERHDAGFADDVAVELADGAVLAEEARDRAVGGLDELREGVLVESAAAGEDRHEHGR